MMLFFRFFWLRTAGAVANGSVLLVFLLCQFIANSCVWTLNSLITNANQRSFTAFPGHFLYFILFHIVSCCLGRSQVSTRSKSSIFGKLGGCSASFPAPQLDRRSLRQSQLRQRRGLRLHQWLHVSQLDNKWQRKLLWLDGHP